MKLKHLVFVFVFLFLVVSLAGNIFLFIKYKSAKNNPIGEAGSIYTLLSPRILFNYPNDLLINFVNLRKNLKDIAASYNGSFAFYFEYLPTGVSIGVNEKNEFSPQSLIKVPIVMALFNYEERTGLNLDQESATIKESQIDSRFGNLWQKGAGYQISLGEAARLALVESDNTAANILADYVPLEDYKEIYLGLDIDFPDKNIDLKLSAKQYSSILKALYFSSVLEKDDSQKILDMLAKTDFKDKLPAGVPSDIKVAHKIGNYGNELFQDCGIVYYPKRPYLLCMISQSTEDEARVRMSKVSSEVFKYISSVNKK